MGDASERVVKKEGFRDTLERHIWQQGLILEAAKRQQIPYSVIRFPSSAEIGGGWVRALEGRSIYRRGARTSAANAKISRKAGTVR